MSSKEEQEWTQSDSAPAHEALCRLLIKLDLVDNQQLSQIGFTPKQGLISELAHRQIFDEWEAIERIACFLGVGTCRIHPEKIPSIVKLFEGPPIKAVPLESWSESLSLPISIEENLIVVAMVNPLDYEQIRTLEFKLDKKIEVVIAKEEEIKAVFDQLLSRGGGAELDMILRGVKEEKAEEPEALGSSTWNPEESIDDPLAPPVVQLVNKIFAGGIDHNASDIHLTPSKESLVVRVRVDGIMRELFTVPAGLRNPVAARIKLLCGMDITEKRRPQDGRLQIKTGVGLKDLRISVVPTSYGENMVIRVLASELGKLQFKDLGMSPTVIKKVNYLLKGSSKVVLVAGPTGSGKTSTLYSCLLTLHDGDHNIITLEDPIEYRIDGITQIQINSKTNLTFAEGLRAILRQDPDIILVGEIRDPETANIAMQVAQTGHLVLSTIHTNTAPAAITRLLDLNVAPFSIAASVGGVVAQRLVRRLCPECKRILTEKERQDLEVPATITGEIYCAQGCSKCEKSGYHGRLGVFSLFDVTPELSDAIRAGRSELELIDIAKKGGYQSLGEAALALIQEGETSISEFERVIGPFEVVGQSSSTAVFVPRQTNEQTGQLSKPRILLVEDDEDTRTVLKMLLERDLFEVIEAADGQAALQLVYNSPPDIILSDVMMPRVNGFELLQRLKADSRTSKIPVLMLTANESEEVELRLIASGAKDFVGKTSRHDVLIARIRRLLPTE